MTVSPDRKIVLVVRPTRLDELVTRFNTVQQAQFYVEHLGADFGDYVREQQHYRAAVLETCLLYTSPSPRDGLLSRMPSSA